MLDTLLRRRKPRGATPEASPALDASTTAVRLPGRLWRPLWRGALRTVRVLRFAAVRARDEHISQAAASLTFTTMLSLVPLLAVAFALFTAFPLFNEFRLALDEFMVNSLMPAAVADGVMNYLNQFATQASRLSTLGGIFLLATAITLIATIDQVLNSIWHVTRQRTWLQRILVYWALLSLGPVMLGASLWTTSFLTRESLGLTGELTFRAAVAVAALPALIGGLFLTALFLIVPNRYVNWRDAMIGAFGAAIVLEFMKAGVTSYLASFSAYTTVYGTFAVLPMFLLWLYLSWLVVLFGATVAASLPLIRFGRREIHRRPGARFIDALEVLTSLLSRRGAVPPGLSTRTLRARLHAHNDEIMSVLDVLEELGYVAQIGEGRKERWALVCDPASASLSPVFDRLLLDREQPLLTDNPLLQERFQHIWQTLAHDGEPLLIDLDRRRVAP